MDVRWEERDVKTAYAERARARHPEYVACHRGEGYLALF
jgi:hypothetical protein